MKKFLAIVLCVLAVCSVFGLNARLDYEQVQIAVESLEGSTDDLQNDLTVFELVSFLVENFDTQSIYEIRLGDDFGNRNELHIVRYSFDGVSNWEIADRVTIVFSDEAFAERMYRNIKPMTWTLNDFNDPPYENGGIGFFDSAVSMINVLVFVFGILLTLVFTLCTFVFDSISAVWQLVRVALWVLGFPIIL